MIQRQYLPGRMFAAAIGAIEQLSEGLIEPPLRRLDEVLGDEQLLAAGWVGWRNVGRTAASGDGQAPRRK